jgi:ferric-dicitrate binding protein FerR (iron transport regulator)
MLASEALEELAQHLPMALRFDPAELQGLRVTGSYPLDRPLDALEAMAGTARMAIEQGPDGELKVSRRK